MFYRETKTSEWIPLNVGGSATIGIATETTLGSVKASPTIEVSPEGVANVKNSSISLAKLTADLIAKIEEGGADPSIYIGSETPSDDVLIWINPDEVEELDVILDDVTVSGTRTFSSQKIMALLAALPSSPTGSLFTHGMLNVKDLGAKGDGITDDTIIIQNIINTAEFGVPIYFPVGKYMVSSLNIKNGTNLIGESKDSTLIKSITGSNKSVITCSCINDWINKVDYETFMLTHEVDEFILGGSIKHLSISGESLSGNTSGSGIDIVANNFVIEDCFIYTCCDYGIRMFGINEQTENEDYSGRESQITNVKIDYIGKDGFVFAGPGDSVITNVIVIDAGYSLNDTYSQFVIEEGFNARFIACHAWHRSYSENRTLYSLNCKGWGSDFTNCHFEGSHHNVFVSGQHNSFSNCKFYAVCVENGVNILVTGNNNVFNTVGISGPMSGITNSIGIKLGMVNNAFVAANSFDVYAVSQHILLDLSQLSTDSYNTFKLRGTQESGTILVGTYNNKTDIDLCIVGDLPNWKLNTKVQDSIKLSSALAIALG